jgi:long-chain acyl-CoA synthetase
VVTTAAAAREDTFPKLIARNARVRPRRPAFRHKDLGIWQSWTWAEVNDIVRAYAVGLKRLGVGRGSKIAVIGYNRPRLYWTIAAAQCLGAVPVPVYACRRAGPGAGRQASRGRRPAADARAHPL